VTRAEFIRGKAEEIKRQSEALGLPLIAAPARAIVRGDDHYTFYS
jgi:hypothetical protein